MISEKEFKKIELLHGCGYYNVCDEHKCPCALYGKNFDECFYKAFSKEQTADDIFDEIAEAGMLDELEEEFQEED